MKYAIVSFTRAGAIINEKLVANLCRAGQDVVGYASKRYTDSELLLPYQGSIDQWTQNLFCTSDVLVYIGAVGIAVRAIAPYLESKDSDPAVVVIDDQAKFVISLLSGHIGGANLIAKQLAGVFDSTAVITTSSDLRRYFAVDTWAVRNQMTICDISMIKLITARILDGNDVGISSDFAIEGVLPAHVSNKEHEVGFCISLDEEKKPFPETLNLVPAIVSVGIGCRKGISAQSIETLLLSVLKDNHISMRAINQIASIDLKKNEPGLLEVTDKYALDFITYDAKELANTEGEFTASDFVSSVTGVDNVCERAAVKASDNGALLVKKKSQKGVTIALAMKNWRVVF